MVSRAAILALCVSTVTCFGARKCHGFAHADAPDLAVDESGRCGSRAPLTLPPAVMTFPLLAAGMPGVSIETGDTVWDPMNLAQWRDPAEMRECELKNGRAAMLAVVGWIWPQVFGLWAANDVTTADPIAAIGQVNELAWVQILAACGMVKPPTITSRRRARRSPSSTRLEQGWLCPTARARACAR